MIGLTQYIFGDMSVVVVQVDHVLVVGTAEDRSNTYKSAEVDVGIDPGTDHFSHVLPTSSLPEILEFYVVFNTLHFILISIL